MHPKLQHLTAKYPELAEIVPDIQQASATLEACYRRGGKVLICGNGGSAADCEHLVGELMKGYLSPRSVPDAVRRELIDKFPDGGLYLADHLQGALPTLSLASQTGLLTAVSNDIGGDMIFAQQVYGYGRQGDALIAISTSGRSRNVVYAVQVARLLGLATIGFTGGSGGALKPAVDSAVCVPHAVTAEIQERHLAIYHALCALLEEAFFPS